ncbi:hypothetical protein [Corynebacterium liangguodongii]|uniref:Uncharacterized protein n=1 Tax=Corynebacterium liangguodongii TaxID=2079535 RepID=A0A2S0WDB8_9CORY|nr:hypothetical protein [Corynebacterium liangguodongii]AWB83756.1 hypothetical protein C3E79_04030 [Corynebacterium liangguodongii]PWB99434.1 hypothetical protein DF219_05765 [Corynebacterium liangguodongii]
MTEVPLAVQQGGKAFLHDALGGDLCREVRLQVDRPRAHLRNRLVVVLAVVPVGALDHNLGAVQLGEHVEVELLRGDGNELQAPAGVEGCGEGGDDGHDAGAVETVEGDVDKPDLANLADLRFQVPFHGVDAPLPAGG